ncbi:MAG: protein translocase subunit SecF [Pseudomonadota bacterium]|nr:protein translocase subunit SecF [Pseudomonadota bacterium]
MFKEINWMGARKLAIGLSLALIVISLISLFTRGLNLGLDFTGGNAIELKVPATLNIDDVRNTMSASGFESFVVQRFGSDTELSIKLPPQSNETHSVGEAVEQTIGEEVFDVLNNTYGDIELASESFIGPSVGDELRDTSGKAMILALVIMLVYIAFRFTLKFGAGAIIALAHDVVITLGFFSITQMSVDLAVLAAILAVVGYSINDTVVVSDRIRENFIGRRDLKTLEVFNVSISETFERTLMTSITTLLVLIALAIFGGSSLIGFSAALIVGVLVGTYSSIYVACSVLIGLNTTAEDFMKKDKQELLDDAP